MPHVTQTILMKQLKEWLEKRLPGVNVFWSDYRTQDRPQKPYLALSFLILPTESIRDRNISLGNGKKSRRGTRQASITMAFHLDDSFIYEKVEDVRNIADALTCKRENAFLYAQGIIIQKAGEVRPLPQQDDIRYLLDVDLMLKYQKEYTIPSATGISIEFEIEDIKSTIEIPKKPTQEL